MQLAHNMVAHVAKECAAAYYEDAARDNVFFKYFPKQKQFVNRCWKHFVKPARVALAKILANPTHPESYKQPIYEALLMDRTLPQGGASVAAVPSAITHH